MTLSQWKELLFMETGVVLIEKVFRGCEVMLVN